MKQKTFTKFTSTIQWDDLSEICSLFAVPLKLLHGPQSHGTAGSSLRTTDVAANGKMDKHCHNFLFY